MLVAVMAGLMAAMLVEMLVAAMAEMRAVSMAEMLAGQWDSSAGMTAVRWVAVMAGRMAD